MKDQLITFETAELASIKGFDEYCLYGYNNLEPDHPEKGKIRNFSDAYTIMPLRKNSEMGPIFTAPTQSLLQKWLREIHGIHVSPVISSRIVNKWNLEIHFLKTHYPNKIFVNYFLPKSGIGDLFSTYEEALEIGLIEALSLIK